MMMTTQTAQELFNQHNLSTMVVDIKDLIIADTISSLVESEESYSHLRDLFIRSGEDIVENYKAEASFIDLSAEYQQLDTLVGKIINNIGENLFFMMWESDKSSALSEVLRCFGHGVSFWDNYNYETFLEVDEMPQIRTTLESPHDIAFIILDKIAEQHPELMIETEKENSDFDIWLAENYSPAGEDASNGEQWYLSVSPNEFMPVSLSTLKEQWEEDNDIQADDSIPDADRFDYLVDEEDEEDEED